tara:strand:- start:83 stop:604 length:522 start_codon:yes stop_codon:yes gene_type:complete
MAIKARFENDDPLPDKPVGNVPSDPQPNEESFHPEKEPEPIKSSLIKKAITFGRAIVSRGLYDNMADEETIAKRELSCHGNDLIEPCPQRQDSKKFPGRTICGACGCGDKPRNFLNGEGYLKTYYPSVSCPVQMPGFDNHAPAKEHENRKKRVEFEINKHYNERANENNKEST